MLGTVDQRRMNRDKKCSCMIIIAHLRFRSFRALQIGKPRAL